MSEPVQTVEQLVAAREFRGLSIADVSQQLKLSPRQVQAIEQADWEALPGPAFTRAVLRGYGRLLGVDVDALVASVAGATAGTELRPTASLDAPIRARGVLGFGSGGSGSSLAWVGLVVLGLVALALFFGGEGGVSHLRSWIGATADGEAGGAPAGTASQADGSAAGGGPAGTVTEKTELALRGAPAATAAGGSGAAGKQADKQADKPADKPAGKQAGGADEARTAAGAAADASSATASAASAAKGPVAAQAAASPGSAPASQADAAAAGAAPASQASDAAPGAAPADPAGTGERVVSLRFARESWIEIRSADGTVLVTGTQQPGTSRSLRFSGRVSLVIGNAEYVKVDLDAKPFDIGPSSQAGVARFSLP